MKKGAIFLAIIIMLTFVRAEPCNLDVSLLNQDPYPALPGEYVDLVFQVKNLENPQCGDLSFELMENYPIELDPGQSGLKEFKKVVYLTDFESLLQIPFKVRINENAIDGSNEIEIQMKNSGSGGGIIIKKFNIEIGKVKTDFETSIKNYDYLTHILTLEILNIGKTDIQALTVEINKQENLVVKGYNRLVVGDLDSNEYTTAEFEAIPKEGDFQISLIYSDAINERRVLKKILTFDSSYFKDRVSDKNEISNWKIFSIISIILVGLWWVFKRKRKRK